MNPPYDALSRWEQRMRDVIYQCKMDVVAMHNEAIMMRDKDGTPLRELANQVEQFAENLHAYIEKRPRLP